MSRFWETNGNCSGRKQLYSYPVLPSRWSLHLINEGFWGQNKMGSELFARIYFPGNSTWEENVTWFLKKWRGKNVTNFPQYTSWRSRVYQKNQTKTRSNFSGEEKFLSGHFQAHTVAGAGIFEGSKTEAMLKSIKSAFSLSLLNKDVIAESCAISYYSVKSDVRGHSLALTALGILAQWTLFSCWVN